jgi:hypothetical protein
MAGLWHHYWAWTGGNVGAMPLQGILAVLFAVCFRKPLARWWHKHFGAQADLREIRETADAARRIAADLFEHHTGREHPDAPAGKGRL